MKTLVVMLTVLLVSSQVYGQKKTKEDPKDLQIAALTYQMDSVSKELIKYQSIYATLIKKVIHYNFDPARTAYLIDSLKMRPMDSTYVKLSTIYADTILVLKKENTSLKAMITLTNSDLEKNKAFMTQEEIDKAKTISSLKQLKELLDAKIITEAEFIAMKQKYLNKL